MTNFEYRAAEFLQSAINGNYDALKSYLDENKDINISFLNQALHHCFYYFNSSSGHFQCIKELLIKGANPNAQDYIGITPLMISCSKANLGLTKFLIEKRGDLNIKDNNKGNALYYAINNETSHECYEICQILLSNGSDINIETNDGFTPLWKAIEKQQVKVVQLLCDKDISVNVANKNNGDTPLHLAVSLKNKQIIKNLMEKFAKTDNRNKKNLTPYDLVKDDIELCEFMKKLDQKQKTSERDEIINSLGSRNLDSGMKSNTNRQQLKLKNYNLSPHLYSREVMLKSERSETNTSESMNPFELEPFTINNQKPQQFSKKQFPPNSQYNAGFNLEKQDSIINHLSTASCFSPPLNMNNQMNPNTPLPNYSYSENSFNQNNNPNSRYQQKNLKKKPFPTRDNNKKPNNSQQGLNNFNRNFNNGASFEYNQDQFNNFPSNNFNQSFNNPINPSMMHYKPPHYHQNSGGNNENGGFMMNNIVTSEKDSSYNYRNLCKNEEIKSLETQNEELKMEILNLERQMHDLNMQDNDFNTQSEENIENHSSKEILTQISIEDSQKSYFLETATLNSKVTLYLPSEVIVNDLNKEIIEFEKLVTQYQQKSLQKFRNFLPLFKSFIQEITKVEPEITTFGSYETGLALPYSDIDIAIHLKLNYPTDESLIQRICENFKKKEANVEWKRHHANNLPINTHKIEVCFPNNIFDHKLNLTFSENLKFNGLKYVKLLKQYLCEMKPLRYLTLIIKEFIYRSKLSNIHKGGMNSYSLVLMIIGFLQHKAKEESLDLKSSLTPPVLGNLLIEFFYHYGFDSEYIFKEIVVLMPENFQDDKSQQPQQSLLETNDSNPKLVIGDPLKRHINVGRSAPIVKIKGAFCLAYMVLHQNYKSNACFCKEENNKSEEVCCCLLERLFTCSLQTGLFRKNNQ